MSTDQPMVLTETRGAVGVLRLNTPDQRNALSEQSVLAISDAMCEFEQDEQVRCVVVTGNGRSFCAGADLQLLRSAIAGNFEPVKRVYDGFLRVLHSPLPTIAAVQGPAVGAGLNMALACDIRFAAHGARFDSRFAELRLHPGGGHTWLLTRAVGPERAMRACLFGEIWTAKDALRFGLISEVVDDADRLVERAVEFGSALAGREPALTRRLAATLRAAGGMSHAEALAAETEAQQWSITQPAFAAGLAQIEKRVRNR